MSVVTWLGYRVRSCAWVRSEQVITNRGPFGSQSVEVASPLWDAALMGVQESRAQARRIEAHIESLHGMTNQLALWNLEHPAPAGTMRGTLTFGVSAVVGATTLTIDGGAGQAGKTILQGDLIGFGTGLQQQVVRIASDATADGSGRIVCSVGTPIRYARTAGDSVIWDKPTALFRLKSVFPGMTYTPEGAQPWSLSLIEDVRP